MKALRSFRSVPRVPDQLAGLRTLAHNMWWHWNHTAAELFRSLDPQLWEDVSHNPILLLERVSPDALTDAAQNDAFGFRLARELRAFEQYCQGASWFSRTHQRESENPLVAYFCAEFALAEFLRTYSGGLGVLAGDHVKAASDLGVPFVGIGLFYHRGFFQQRLSLDGWQMETYPYNDPAQMPMSLAKSKDGTPLRISVKIAGAEVLARVWRVDVGRVSLYLLDTNVPENTPTHRSITDRLYGGDRDHRIAQEIVLGIGGARVLSELGLQPDVYHLNEGHAAFLIVERLRQMISAVVPMAAALEAVRASNVFTTHTPVPAGNEVFPRAILERHLTPYLAEIGLPWNDFLRLGAIHADQDDFGMTVFALRLSSYANGVSKLHGKVSRGMWRSAWGDILEEEVPIHHVTNGAHITTWVSDGIADLYDSYIGPVWREEPDRIETWDRVESIPSAELWRAHERTREGLVHAARKQLARQLSLRHASPMEIRTASEVLDPERLTLGFARRVATYKRLRLLLHDPDRFHALLTSPDRPLQILIAGKAHPDDEPAKQVIQSVVEFARHADSRGSLVFLENYDMHLASLMVSGVDVWLNTPRRPLEASGTSGMKAAVNGVLNLSVLDGWWDEAYDNALEQRQTEVGWALGDHDGDALPDEEADRIDANVLYTLLERDVAPMFYNRDAVDVPQEWVRRMKASIRELAPRFNTHRMVMDYVEQAYVPVADRRARLSNNDWAGARELGAWKNRVIGLWDRVRIRKVDVEAGDVITAGVPVRTTVEVELGELTPDEVRVEVVVGKMSVVDVAAPMAEPHVTRLVHNPNKGDAGAVVFEGEFSAASTGQLGVTARVLPLHAELPSPVEMGLVTWA